MSGQKEMYLEFGDTLEAVEQDTRRDSNHTSWRFKNVSEDAVGWE
jgi:hypothetical protein